MTIKQTSRNLPARIISCILTVCLLLCTLAACQDPADPTTGSSFPTTPPSPTNKPTEPPPPAPTDPAPTEPAPTEPAPTEPAPTEPAPTEPAPTEPIADYSWLVGTWSSAVRYDEPDSISTLSLLSITFLENGRGSIDDDGLTNFDIINGCLLDHWAAPGDIAFTSEEFTYAIEGDKLAITFVYHEFVAYEPFTVYFPIPEPANGMITLGEPNGKIQDAALGGSLIGRTFVKGPISVEDLCAVLGVDYTVPPVQGDEAGEIPKWMSGTWEHLERYDYSYGVCVLRSQYFIFSDSGTGYLYYDREWSNYNEYGAMTNEWNYLTEDPPTRRFTYSMYGDVLVLRYRTGETEEYILQRQNVDSFTLTNTQTGESLLYVKYYINYSLDKMCRLHGIDYKLPRAVYDLSPNTWQTVWRENTNNGSGILHQVTIRFKEDGTADYTKRLYLSGNSWQEVPERSYSGTFSYEQKQYYLTVSNIVGNVSLYEGNYTLYREDDGYIYFCAPQGEPEHEYEKLYSVEEGTSLEQLCSICNVDYSLPPMKEPEGVPTADQLAGTWIAIEREDWQGGVYGLRYSKYTFRADGTGEELRGCYTNLDDDGNYLDHWIERSDERWSCTFTYTYSNGTLSMDGMSYSVTLSEDGILHLTNSYQYETKYMTMKSDPSLYGVCKKLGVDTSVPLRDTPLQGTFTHLEPVTSAGGAASLAATDFSFKADGTGTKTVRTYNAAEHKWESTASSFTYELMDMLYITYDNGDSAYYEVFLMEEGIISISDMWDQYVKFVDNDLAPTLEEQCKILGIQNPIPAA